jgi:hypothetical protein
MREEGAFLTSGRAINTEQYSVLNLPVHNSNSFRAFSAKFLYYGIIRQQNICSADNSVGSFVYVLYGRNSKLGFATPCFVRPSIYDLDHV